MCHINTEDSVENVNVASCFFLSNFSITVKSSPSTDGEVLVTDKNKEQKVEDLRGWRR